MSGTLNITTDNDSTIWSKSDGVSRTNIDPLNPIAAGGHHIKMRQSFERLPGSVRKNNSAVRRPTCRAAGAVPKERKPLRVAASGSHQVDVRLSFFAPDKA
jgi:hypothetical protein